MPDVRLQETNSHAVLLNASVCPQAQVDTIQQDMRDVAGSSGRRSKADDALRALQTAGLIPSQNGLRNFKLLALPEHRSVSHGAS